MIGWFADLFRLAAGLLYWNTRKSWFRLRRGRSRVPCQSLSDSGRAYETVCEACVQWHRPKRFQHICPLLVETKDGLRCSVNTADVRPFWGIVARDYGAVVLSLYAAAVLGVFIVLRTIGYPVSILHVGLPPLWHKVGQARGWYFFQRSDRAFAAGRTSEGLLYLANAYEFDPANYTVGMMLAKNYQAGQPAHSNAVFEQLLRDHPAKRGATAEAWFRALLARGDFEKIATLARDQILADASHASVWVRALLFATSRTGKVETLRDLIEKPSASAAVWRPIFETELLLRTGRTREARAAIDRGWTTNSPQVTKFSLYYRVDTLVALGDPSAAALLLINNSGTLDAETDAVTLKLEVFAAVGSKTLLAPEIDRLLAPRLASPAGQRAVVTLCAQLIRYPDRAIFDRLCAKLEREPIPLTTETVGIWFSMLCTAGAVGDLNRLQQFTAELKVATKTPFVTLSIVEAFFRGETVERRITTFLPILPLPLEVTYALIERFAAPPPVGVPSPAKSK